VSGLSYDSGTEEIFNLTGGSSQVQLEKDTVIALGWGKRISKFMYVGGQAKSINSKLADQYTGTSPAYDAGVMLQFFDGSLIFNCGAQNMGGKLKYDQESEPLPQAMRGGVALRFGEIGKGSFIIGAQARKLQNVSQPDLGGGIEIAPSLAALPVAVRGGVQRNSDGQLNFTAGGGLTFGILRVDYSYEPVSTLGGSLQKFALTLGFGK
jgi:hypothetical protein